MRNLPREYYILDGLFSGILNYAAQSQTNYENKLQANKNLKTQDEWRREDKAWQESQTAKLWQREDDVRNMMWNREDALRAEQYMREDNSYQRSVADAVAAGLSPLAVTQLDGSAGNVVASNANDSAAMSAPSTGNPASYTAQPSMFQMDMSSLIGALVSQKNLDEVRRHNKAQESQAKNELEAKLKISNDELTAQADQFHATLKQTDDHFWANYSQCASQFSSQLSQAQQFHLDEMSAKDKALAWSAVDSQNRQIADMSKDFAKSIGVPYHYKYYTSESDYNSALQKLKDDIISGNRDVLNDVGRNPEDFFQSESASGSQADSFGLRAGAGVNSGSSVSDTTKDIGRKKSVFSSILNSVTEGLNVNAGADKSHSESNGYSVTQSDLIIKERIQQSYNGSIEIPVYIRDYDHWERSYKSWK